MITLNEIQPYADQAFTVTKELAQQLYVNICNFPKTIPEMREKINQDNLIRNIAATVLGIMGLAAFVSSLPILGSLASLFPAMAPAFSGLFPFAYATAAVVLSYQLFQQSATQPATT